MNASSLANPNETCILLALLHVCDPISMSPILPHPPSRLCNCACPCQSQCAVENDALVAHTQMMFLLKGNPERNHSWESVGQDSN